MNRKLFLASALLPILALGALHCGTKSEDSSDEDDGALLDGLLSPYETPDPNNPWTKNADLASYDLGQENVLADEDARFAQLSSRVRTLQDKITKAKNDGKPERTFHAKSHACLNGELRLRSGTGLPAAGLFSPENVAKPHPTLVRLSNGVGFRQADKKVDVRGVGFKIKDVVGEPLPGAPPGVQDILFTNGVITPAPHSEHFVEFMEVSVDAALAGDGSIFDTAKGFLGQSKYLLDPKNERVRRNIEAHMAPSALKYGSFYGEHFWSGGAIALGVHDGDPLKAAAVDAIKLNVLVGAPHTESNGTVTCTPVSKAPNPFDADYFRKDVVERLKTSGMCFDLRVQIQKDAKRQPIEDTSVEWQEKDTKSVSVGFISVPPTDLTSPEAAAREGECNAQAFTPWNGLAAHRPLGNIMRVRRVVYDASAAARAGTRADTRR